MYCSDSCCPLARDELELLVVLDDPFLAAKGDPVELAVLKDAVGEILLIDVEDEDALTRRSDESVRSRDKPPLADDLRGLKRGDRVGRDMLG